MRVWALVACVALAAAAAEARRVYVMPQGMRTPHCPVAGACAESLQAALAMKDADELVLLGNSYKAVLLTPASSGRTLRMRRFQPGGPDHGVHFAHAERYTGVGGVRVELIAERGVVPPRIIAGTAVEVEQTSQLRHRRLVREPHAKRSVRLDPYGPYSDTPPRDVPRVPFVVFPTIAVAALILLAAIFSIQFVANRDVTLDLPIIETSSSASVRVRAVAGPAYVPLASRLPAYTAPTRPSVPVAHGDHPHLRFRL